MGQLFDTLPPQQRSQHYREMADAAFLKARHATDPEQQAECLGVAMGWHAMALELDANLRHLAQFEASQAKLRETGKEAKAHQ